MAVTDARFMTRTVSGNRACALTSESLFDPTDRNWPQLLAVADLPLGRCRTDNHSDVKLGEVSHKWPQRREAAGGVTQAAAVT